ncbi:MAG: DNA-directed RNA polymerase subunit omega [Ignavibacteriales bacterium]|jgi:DNA-directed RNA polymerase subunit K/omega|nr:DNA-directed RNA polymerase subunit omega [Ignavibacteriales bacterium]MBK7266057.1 DNA-directed RNA polymerase subunit omega [Ignavibacteriales bacterium]MBK8663960.1 DNA-directed RNA polymerase subunit omega [Ignavibacteriales bacterium]MBP7543183.1 DNA-directed RNA polymerase subunit omega [Ignavibacteriaceae bacterium]MBP9123799.1 DNA-directed RNA polymerase subunit omega [Ignavibacteriaceae bacterium]
MGITPVDLREIDKNAANVYEAIVIAARRARIINDAQRIEFRGMLDSLPENTSDDGEDLDNPDQSRISLEFEKRDKPHLQALGQLLDGKIKSEYRDRD